MITVILLAAGASRRMGQQDKLQLNYQGASMLSHSIQTVLAAEIGELIVVRPNDNIAFLSKNLRDKVKIVVNPHPEKGMTSSIQAGLAKADEKASGYLIGLADMPLLTTADYNRLIIAFQAALNLNPATIALPFFEGKKGNPVIFSASYYEALINNPFPEGGREIIKSQLENLTRVEMDSSSVLVDVDRPEDWERLMES